MPPFLFHKVFKNKDMGRERRITEDVGTIPNNTVLAGTVTTDTVDTKVLIYSGSNDIAGIISIGAVSVTDSTFWLYVPSNTPYISRITGIHTNTDIDGNPVSYSLTLESAIPSCSAETCYYVQAGVQFSYLNDGDVDVNVNGVSVKPGDSNNYAPFEIYGNRPKLQPVCYVDASASGATIFISEEL
jgi:hypothetical protein